MNSQVIVLTGLSGAGKSTLADPLARDLGVPSFAGDSLLGALAPAHHVPAKPDRPDYLAMYHSLLESLITRQLILDQGATVDCAVNDTVAQRWQTIADEYRARLHIVDCVCSDEHEHRRRVEGRQRHIPGWRDVDWNHVQRMRTETPPLTVDAINPVDDNLGRIHT